MPLIFKCLKCLELMEYLLMQKKQSYLDVLNVVIYRDDMDE